MGKKGAKPRLKIETFQVGIFYIFAMDKRNKSHEFSMLVHKNAMRPL